MRCFFLGMVCFLLPVSLNAQTAEALLEKSKAVLPALEGELRLPGLKEPVEVLRDRWGVPHIYAKNADDLFFAQGFVAAQDRLFQLDMWRRLGQGEMAEILGPEALEGDRFARLVRYRGDMEAEWSSYAPDTKAIATAFTRGINGCIDHLGDKLPIEFQILKFKPKKWQPEDVLGRMSGIVMSRNFTAEVARARLVAGLGLPVARQVAPVDPAISFAPVPGLDLACISSRILASYEAAIKPLGFKPEKSESNNWVVTGSRSASGKPMLASDPHRALGLPALRYLVHLNAPGWNVIGAGEPALPGIALGHNERVAWGITIVGTDQADLFVEETHPDKPGLYRVGENWQPMVVVQDKVQVKGEQQPRSVKLFFTRHGPVIHQEPKLNRAFALKWAGSEPGGAAYLGALSLARAGNWPEFQKGLAGCKIPSLNYVYADVEGHVGWVANALTPVREGFDGLLPVPGASGKYGWKRFRTVEELPQAFNPPVGFVATANHNILPPDYKNEIGYEWAPPYRYEVVRRRLEEKKTFTLDDFKSIQQEVTSLPGRELAQLLLNLKFIQPGLVPYQKMLGSWDGVLSKDSAAGAIFAAWQGELMDAFYRRRVPAELLESARSLGGLPTMLQALKNPTSAWFDERPVTSRDALVNETLARAVEKMKKLQGDDPAGWRWGKVHTASFRHPLAALGPAYAKAFDLPTVERPGDANTPNNTRFDSNYRQVHGATYRHLFDLADWDKGLATSSPGQSGQPGSPHYGDLLPLWAEGEYFPLAYSRGKVEEVTRNRLVLRP